MGQEAKLQVFSNMLDSCSHQDQLSLHKELEIRLSRDFITFLPPEIAIMVLSYLPVESLLTGLQVCRSWREVISGATPLWRKTVSEIGLSEAIVKTYLPEYGSYMDLTLVALRHRKLISSYVPDVVIAEESTIQMIESAGCYVIGKEFDAWNSDDFSFPRNYEIKQICSDGSLMTLHSFSVPMDVGVQFGPFSSISNGEFVFWGSNEGWVGWSDPCSSSSHPSCKSPRMEEECGLARIDINAGLHLWRTNEVSCTDVFVCLSCGLVAILMLHTSNQDDGVSHVLLRRLTPWSSTIKEVGRGILQLPAGVTVDNYSDDFNVMFFPKECEGVCGSHYLLVMYVPDYCKMSLYLVPAESSYTDSKKDCVLSETEIPAELQVTRGSLRVYRSSYDGSVVTICEIGDEEYIVWEPESGKIVRVHFPTPRKCHFCLAVGKLYSILGGVEERESAFAVVETYTGVVLFSGTAVSDLGIRPPIDQAWLSTFEAPEYLPIATLWSNRIAELSIKSGIGSVIARRGNSI